MALKPSLREMQLVGLHLAKSFYVPDEIEFLGLAVPEGTEKVRLRFRRSHFGSTLDIPLSEAVLNDLMRYLCPLCQKKDDEVDEILDQMEESGGLLPPMDQIS